MGRFLPQALRSLLAQTLPREQSEIIVVDDGSTDDTAEVLARFAKDVRALRQPQRGLVAAVNAGLKLARGRYFVRVDADDQAAPDLLALGCRLLSANPQGVCVFSDHFEVRDGRRVRKRTDPQNLYTLIACGTTFRTALLREVGGYRKLYWEEYDLYLRLREHGEFLHLPLPLYFYRKHSMSMTHRAGERKRGWQELIDYWGADRLRSAGRSEELDRILSAHAVR